MTLHMIEHGEWEPHVRQIIAASLKHGSNYCDVGGNIGLHTLYAAAIVGNDGLVVVYEPNPRLFKILKDNIEVNGFSNRAVLKQNAVADYNGENIFYLYEGHASMSGFMDVHTDFDYDKQKIRVNVTSLDESIDSNIKIDCLKVDVEGFELNVLKGSKRILANNDITVILEWVPKYVVERMGENALDEILDIFKSENFNVYCSEYGKVLRKLNINDYENIKNISGCDLVFSRDNHLDYLCKVKEVEHQEIDERDSSIMNDELIISEREELIHLRKAYAEAIAVQEQLKTELSKKSIFSRFI